MSPYLPVTADEIAEAHAARQEWRDRRLMALLSHKAAQTP
jgi:hypothetical protein